MPPSAEAFSVALISFRDGGLGPDKSADVCTLTPLWACAALPHCHGSFVLRPWLEVSVAGALSVVIRLIASAMASLSSAG